VDLGLSGRTALVCGASSGLGLASAEALAEEGANVVLFARRAEQLDEHADRLGGVAVAGDVREESDLDRAVSTAVDRFGGLDVVVWNGGGPPPGTPPPGCSTPRPATPGRPPPPGRAGRAAARPCSLNSGEFSYRRRPAR